jgi:hypothetical protein
VNSKSNNHNSRGERVVSTSDSGEVELPKDVDDETSRLLVC